MYAVVGILFLATAALVSAWSHAQFRRPNRSRWTEHELPALAITLAELTLLTSGLFLFGRFLVDVAAQPFGLAEAASVAVFSAAFIADIVLLRVSWWVRQRRRGPAPDLPRDLPRTLPWRAAPRGARASRDPRRHRSKPIPSRTPALGTNPAKRDAA